MHPGISAGVQGDLGHLRQDPGMVIGWNLSGSVKSRESLQSCEESRCSF